MNMYHIKDVKCEGPGGGVALRVVTVTGDLVSLAIYGYEGMDGKKYLSSIAGDKSYGGSLAVVDDADVNCRFRLEKVGY